MEIIIVVWTLVFVFREFMDMFLVKNMYATVLNVDEEERKEAKLKDKYVPPKVRFPPVLSLVFLRVELVLAMLRADCWYIGLSSIPPTTRVLLQVLCILGVTSFDQRRVTLPAAVLEVSLVISGKGRWLRPGVQHWHF